MLLHHFFYKTTIRIEVGILFAGGCFALYRYKPQCALSYVQACLETTNIVIIIISSLK